jgi:hypothetical protein
MTKQELIDWVCKQQKSVTKKTATEITETASRPAKNSLFLALVLSNYVRVKPEPAAILAPARLSKSRLPAPLASVQLSALKNFLETRSSRSLLRRKKRAKALFFLWWSR